MNHDPPSSIYPMGKCSDLVGQIRAKASPYLYPRVEIEL